MNSNYNSDISIVFDRDKEVKHEIIRSAGKSEIAVHPVWVKCEISAVPTLRGPRHDDAVERMCEYRERPPVVSRTKRERDCACASARGMCALAYLCLPPGPRRAPTLSHLVAAGPFHSRSPSAGPAAISSLLLCHAARVRYARCAGTRHALRGHFIRRCDVIRHAECALRTHVARTNVRARADVSMHVDVCEGNWKACAGPIGFLPV